MISKLNGSSLDCARAGSVNGWDSPETGSGGAAGNAAARAPRQQLRDARGRGGLRISLDGRTGTAMLHSNTKLYLPPSIAFTGDVRRAAVPELAAARGSASAKTTVGGAVDVVVPILTGTEAKQDSWMSPSGELAYGQATADLDAGMVSGIAFPSPPVPEGEETAPPFAAVVDPGMVAYVLDGELRSIDWLSRRVSLQCRVAPFKGTVWEAATCAHLDSVNSDELDAAPPAFARKSEDWEGGMDGYDATSAFRFAGGYSYYRDE